MKTGTDIIKEERERQIAQEGWTPEHDDEHTASELSIAAGCYIDETNNIVQLGEGRESQFPGEWPWANEWWKPSDDPVRNLAKAGALIAAEIDRLQRSNGGAVVPDRAEE